MDIVWQWLGLWFSAFSSATILPGTSDVVLLAFVNANPQLWLGALLLATLGNGMGGMVSYGMGRMVPDKHRPSERIHGWIQKYGVWALLMSWVPFVGDGLAIAAGWLRLNFWLSSLMLVLGKFARYAVLVLGFFAVI
ncbi:YqaA family protein [Paralysiella testudinis]|uniref:DedA family protein n=1 Tax=Paralysiella testudinis TaxID=2809020 RepID=A0A892ZIJ0_9NEIS|nr:DedA family protein [Paralysiella testudinis]QRQ82248.1 DedA family protein [Paralysiella testudinis]